jgi:hypothetical protein
LRAPASPGEKVGCAKIEMEACIAGQRTLQGTKQNFVVIAQIFDHCQLARMHSRTLLEAGASQDSVIVPNALAPSARMRSPISHSSPLLQFLPATIPRAARQDLAIRCACCPQYWPCRENLTVSRFRLRSRFRPRARANDRPIPFVARPMTTYRFGSAAC